MAKQWQRESIKNIIQCKKKYLTYSINHSILIIEIENRKQRRHNMKKISKIIAKVITILFIIFLAWLAISYIEVILKNLTDNPTYNSLNLFKLLIHNN